jgi:hypothetical protein
LLTTGWRRRGARSAKRSAQPVRDRRASAIACSPRAAARRFPANGGAATKLRMLALEGAPLTASRF